MGVKSYLILTICTCFVVYTTCSGDFNHGVLPQGLVSKLVSRLRVRRDGTSWTTRPPGTWVPPTGTPYRNLTEVEIANQNKENSTDLDSNGFPKPYLGTKRPSVPITGGAHDTNGKTANQDAVTRKMGSLVGDKAENSTQFQQTPNIETTEFAVAMVTTIGTRGKQNEEGCVNGGLERDQTYLTVIVLLAGSLCVCVVVIATFFIRRVRRQRKVVIVNA